MAWKRTDKRFTAKQHAEMRRLYHRGMTLTHIAERAGCTAQSVSWIVKKPDKKSKVEPKVTMDNGSIKVETRQPVKQLPPEVESYVMAETEKARREIEEYLAWRELSASKFIGGVSFLDYFRKVSA